MTLESLNSQTRCEQVKFFDSPKTCRLEAPFRQGSHDPIGTPLASTGPRSGPYALSVCLGDFNEWIWKLTTTDWPNSYMYVPEYETPHFNLGQTFGHAEMAALIAPRAFMVERGHDDGVGIDEWVSFEYARVRRLYNQLGIPHLTEMEVFDGGHEIHAVGTFRFIHRVFGWPEPKVETPGR